jgi:hypothetical protein
MDLMPLSFEDHGPCFKSFPVVPDEGLYTNILHPISRSFAGKVMAEYLRMESLYNFLYAINSTLIALQIPAKIEFERRNYNFDGKTISYGVLVRFSLFEDHIRLALRHKRKRGEYIDFEKHVMPILCGNDQSSPQTPDHRYIMLRMHRWMTVTIYGDPVKRYQLNFDLLYPTKDVFKVDSLSAVVKFLRHSLDRMHEHYMYAFAYVFDSEKDELTLKNELFEKIKVL